MMAKKTERADLSKRVFTHFLIGLSISIAFSWAVLETKTYESKIEQLKDQTIWEPIETIKNPVSIVDSSPPSATKEQKKTKKVVSKNKIKNETKPKDLVKAVDFEPIQKEKFTETKPNFDPDTLNLDNVFDNPLAGIENDNTNSGYGNSNNNGNGSGNEAKSHRVLEFQPVFKGCENIPENQKIKCFGKKSQEFIYKRLQKRSKSAGINKNSNFVVSFVINENGKVTDLKANGFGDNKIKKLSKEIIQSFPYIKPGKQNGRAVKTRFQIPIKINTK